VGDGSVIPPFVCVKSSQLVEENPIEGVELFKWESKKGEYTEMVLSYLDYCYDEGYLSPHELVLLDRHRSHTSNAVKNWFREHEIEFEFYPPSGGALLDPVDNNFNALFKQNFQQLNTENPVDSEEDEVKLIKEAYYKISSEAIEKWFGKTGIIGGNPTRVVAKLMQEFQRVPQQRKRKHLQMLAKYRTFMKAKRQRKEDA
jgi:hypothetical protein